VSPEKLSHASSSPESNPVRSHSARWSRPAEAQGASGTALEDSEADDDSRRGPNRGSDGDEDRSGPRGSSGFGGGFGSSGSGDGDPLGSDSSGSGSSGSVTSGSGDELDE
jgi:hypothetical protein